MNEFKQKAAEAALIYVKDHTIIGLGSGSTVNAFIEILASLKFQLEGCVVASKQTEACLRAVGIPVIELNSIGSIPLYIDGADEVNPHKQMIKGGGAALAREKILATASDEWICIVDESKIVDRLGRGPIPVEVLPMARSFVARELVKLGGDPVYRDGVITDNQNCILDVYNLELNQPIQMEEIIKQLPGVIENGIFAKRSADRVIVAGRNGVYEI
jgi:ribose 5-phosphate isomerase A